MSDTATENAYHYGIIRRAIERIDAAGGTGLSLDALAADMQMSPAHFQRVFSRWAGVSPKRLQQYLTLGHAKALLHDRHTTLDTADAVGLSAPGAGSIDGTVTAIEFQGTHVSVSARIAGDQEVTALLPDARFFEQPNNPGDPVGLTWETDQLHKLSA